MIRDTEEAVAIKVQRPDIQKTIEVDLGIMLDLASLAERNVEELKVLHPTKVAGEFAHSMDEETDYTIEAAHVERFARQFLDDATIYVPRVFHDWSSRRILTMEYIQGIKASDLDRLRQEGCDLKEIADRGADLIMKQIFVHGFYHADPHPGNVFILPYEVICFIDFGMMGRISEQEREDFTDLVRMILSKDEKKAVDALLKVSIFAKDPDRAELERDMGDFFDQFLYLSLKELDVGKMLQRVLEILTKQGISLKPELFLMLKALVTAEGLGRSLDPDFQIVEHAEPFLRDIQSARYAPANITGDLIDSGTEVLHLLKEVPGELREILRNIKQGKLRIEVDYPGADRTVFKLDRIADRIASAIVLASLIIGSSVVTLSGSPPSGVAFQSSGSLVFLWQASWGSGSWDPSLKEGRRMKND